MVEFEYKAYRRTFAKKYQTASDSFEKRLGVLIRLRDADGRVGFGEAAPIESFGSETIVSALAACLELRGKFEYETVRESLSAYPCLRFGIEFALEMMGDDSFPKSVSEPWPVCGLIPELEDLERVERLLEEGYRCLKFKIGKDALLKERQALDRIVGLTSGEIPIRLDANGGLDLNAAREWLEFLADLPVEFLEQPMGKGSEDTMIRLSHDYPTALALDESVCSVDDLKRWRDQHWPGVFVIKPSLSGGYRELIDELKEGDASRLVFSSALETMVGATAAISVGLEVAEGSRSLGFGVESLFSDRNAGLFLGPFLQRSGLPDRNDFEALWNRI